jgi:acetoacetate decarboxylase
MNEDDVRKNAFAMPMTSPAYPPRPYRFVDYTEAGPVITVRFRGESGSYVHAMFLDCEPPISAGRPGAVPACTGPRGRASRA